MLVAPAVCGTVGSVTPPTRTQTGWTHGYAAPGSLDTVVTTKAGAGTGFAVCVACCGTGQRATVPAAARAASASAAKATNGTSRERIVRMAHLLFAAIMRLRAAAGIGVLTEAPAGTARNDCLMTTTTDESAFLRDERQAILDSAVAALKRAHARHYEAEAPAEVYRRLADVYDEVDAAFTKHDLSHIVEFARELARRRYATGYDLSEVQTAFNVLEEAIWLRAFATLSPAQFAPVITRASTILGAAKDALAREYVALATHGHAPALDLPALFAGS